MPKLTALTSSMLTKKEVYNGFEMVISVHDTERDSWLGNYFINEIKRSCSTPMLSSGLFEVIGLTKDDAFEKCVADGKIRIDEEIAAR